MEPHSPDPIPEAIPTPAPQPRRPRWWSVRRPWLPLILTLAIAGSASFVSLRMVGDRDDLRSEAAATEKEVRELNETVKEQAAEIEDLEEQAEAALGSGQECTLAAETGVEVLTVFIQAIELASQGDTLQAQKEYADMTGLARDAQRATKSCVAGLKGVRDKGEAELL